MRRTQKRIAAENLSHKLKISDISLPNDQLYAELQNAGYVWDAIQIAWIEGKRAASGEPLSNSEFETVSGQPSGVVKIRLMGHPADVHLLAKLIRDTTAGLNVISISEQYPNRKGAGSRIYIDAMLK